MHRQPFVRLFTSFPISRRFWSTANTASSNTLFTPSPVLEEHSTYFPIFFSLLAWFLATFLWVGLLIWEDSISPSAVGSCRLIWLTTFSLMVLKPFLFDLLLLYSSRRSFFVPTNIIGVSGQFWRISECHFVRMFLNESEL